MLPFNLNILPLDSLIAVEKPLPKKVKAIRNEFLRTNHLPNPLLVSSEIDGRHMLLQGTNQVCALRYMGVDYAVVQEIDPTEAKVQYLSWYHLVKHYKPEYLFAIADHYKLKYQPLPKPFEIEIENNKAILGVFLNGEAYKIIPENGNLINRANSINRFVESYQSCSSHIKLYPDKIFLEAGDLFDQGSLLIIPPVYTPEEIYVLAQAKIQFPPDYLNIVLNDRIVGLDFPLEVLRSPVDLEEKVNFLKELVSMRLQSTDSNVYGGKVYFLNRKIFNPGSPFRGMGPDSIQIRPELE